ncbi:MAG: C2H2-type zinc finger protein [Candidatus Bathyarchaeota archaeon]|nr:C2H2-type zinc finger protein [Candidatus Bathyarchaeota archaeon]
MTKPDSPAPKKPRDPKRVAVSPSSPENPPSPKPLNRPNPEKFTCLTCGETFSTREELSLHMEMAHHTRMR